MARLTVALGCATVSLALLPLWSPGAPLGDDLSIHFAEIAHLLRAWSGGDLSMWNPQANMGFASGYFYQVLPQALVALVALVANSLVPLMVLFKAAIAIPLVLLPATTYRALVVSGMARWPAASAAFAVGVAFSSSRWGLGLDSMFTTGLFTQAWGMLFYPLALAHAWRYLSSGRGLERAVLYPLLVGLCHPFIALCLVPALAVAPWWRVSRAALSGRAVALAALVLAASAFFWVPILVHYDAFGGFVRLPGESGLEPAAFTATVLDGRLIDAGRLPVLTALLAPALVVAVRRCRVIAVLLGQGFLFAALVMLGPRIGQVGSADLLPSIRFLAPMQLAFAAAAGAAFVELLVRAGDLLAAGARRRRLQPWMARGAIGLAALVVAGYLVSTALERGEARVRTVVHRGVGEVTELLADLPPGRFLGAAEYGTGSHLWMYLPSAFTGRPSVRAYGGAALQSSPNYRYLRTTDPVALARLYGVRYVIARVPSARGSQSRRRLRQPPRGRRVARIGDVVVIEVGDGGLFAPIDVVGTFPRSREGRRKAVEAWLRSPDPAVGRHLGLGDGSLPPRAEHEPPERRARVLSETRGHSRYTADVEVTASRPQLVLLRVSYHPGWQARIDGDPLAIHRVSPAMMAVAVPPGRHRVTFEFRRPPWTWALLLIPAGLITLMLGRRLRRAFIVRSASCGAGRAGR